MDALRAASGQPCCPPFTTVLSLGNKEPRSYLVRLRRAVWACLGAPGGCPGASISDLCAIGGGSPFGLWGWPNFWLGLGLACLLAPPLWHAFLYCGVTVLGWYMCSDLVGGLLVGACGGVFGWLPLCSVVGLRSGADVTRLCVCL